MAREQLGTAPVEDVDTVTKGWVDENRPYAEAVRIITVGAGGNFTTLNDAIKEASRYAPQYVYASNRLYHPLIEIRQLAGFVMAEQVFVVGQDLSHVAITSEDAEVTITRSALATNYGGSDENWRSGTYPAFCAARGAKLPCIKTLYSMDDSGTGAGTVGVYIFENSMGVVAYGAGVKNAGWRGLYVDGGYCYARGTVWDGAGYATGPEGTLAGVRVSNGGQANVREASVKDCASGIFCSAGWVSAIAADVSGAGSGDAGAEGYGLAVTDGGTAIASGIVADDATERGFYIANGSYCYAGASSGGVYASAANCGTNAARVEDGSTLVAPHSTLTATGNHAVSVSASRADLVSAVVTSLAGCGISASDGADINAEAATVTGTDNWGARLYASKLDAYGAKIGGTSGGVQLNTGSLLNKNGATALDGVSALSSNRMAGDVSPEGLVYGDDQRLTFRSSDSDLGLTGSTTEVVACTGALTQERTFTLYDSSSYLHKRHTVIHAGTGKNIKLYMEPGASTLLAILAPGESATVVPNGSGGWVALASTHAAVTDFNRSSLVAGVVYTYTGSSPQTPQLPLASLSTGRRIVAKNASSSTVTVSRQGSDGIYLDAGASVTSVVIPSGGSLELWSDGSEWIATSFIIPDRDEAAYVNNDVLGWTYDPATVLSGTVLPAVATLNLCRIPLRRARTITNVLAYMSGAGDTLTHSYLALFKSDGTLLGQSADQSTAWGVGGTTGLHTVPLAAPVAVAPSGANDFVWAAIYVGTATTRPTFARGMTGNATVLNAGTTSTRRRFATLAVADTATLTSITPSSMAVAGNAWWMALT